jgi:hypothetical protein
MRRAAQGATLVACAVAVGALAQVATQITAFSSLPPGDLAAPWRLITLSRIKPPQVALVPDAGTTVLWVRSPAASGSVAHALDVSPRGLALAWRWKIDRVVETADMTRKSGDDYAARVYVFFDVPASQLPFATWLKLKAYRIIYGKDLPTAALCYVWDNRHPVGTTQWNAYTERVRMIVLRSGNGESGAWREERRDIEADFRAAFPADGDPPRVSGVAAGNDTDQTGETVTAWFGDLRLEALR